MIKQENIIIKLVTKPRVEKLNSCKLDVPVWASIMHCFSSVKISSSTCETDAESLASHEIKVTAFIERRS